MISSNNSRNRAVSPVIGSVLLVAIAVIVMVTLGVQVLSGEAFQEQPEAELVFDEDPDASLGGELTIGVRRAT